MELPRPPVPNWPGMRFLILLSLTLPAQPEVLQVTLLDHVGVPETTRRAAEEFLTQVFAQAGTRLQIRTEQSPWWPGQTQNMRDVSGDVILRLCSKDMAGRMVPKSVVFGYVQPVAPKDPPRVANVFYHRVLELEKATLSPAARVLGAVLAHELGHLLLGRGSHSAVGIMRCPWDTAELRELEKGTLVFDRQQRTRIIDEVRRRESRNQENRSAGRSSRPTSGICAEVTSCNPSR